MNEQQTFIQQRNILKSCLSDLSSNCLNFSLHNLLFRKFLTLADVSNYYYQKSILLVTSANLLCIESCLIPIPFVDLPIYYSIHYSMVCGILAIFGIKLNEVDFTTIMKTNGVNLGSNYSIIKNIKQIINISLKVGLNFGKLACDAAPFIPFLSFVGKVPDIVFSGIDTSILGRNLIKTCNQLPKNQQFFKNELEKFYYVLSKIDEVRLRLANEHNNNN